MSAGYASRLSAYPNKGICGLPERYDSRRSLTLKLRRLSEWVNKSKHCVVLTGAGISTSAGIPDFRGPNGIWTAEQKQKGTLHSQSKKYNNKRRKLTKDDDDDDDDTTTTTTTTTEKDATSKHNNNDDNNNNHTNADDDIVSERTTSNRKRQLPPNQVTSDESTSSASSSSPRSVKSNTTGANTTTTTTNTTTNSTLSDFSAAKPTMTHRAITKLVSLGKVKYCITQNVDGLHRRSGLSRKYHCALHGCAFTEKCLKCNKEYFRDNDVGGMSFKPTGRLCEHCNDGKLHDTLLDWEDPLPEDDFQRAEDECDKSDLVICLGTSLRIEPAGSLPKRALKFVIVNLQDTPYDTDADMVIRASVDDVMNDLLTQLGYPDWDNNNNNNNDDDDDDDDDGNTKETT